jgi:hypothetical protein
MQFELGLRYGVIFTTGQSLSLFSSYQNVMIFDRCFWARDELARVVWDKYEPNPGPVPTQFFHYDQRYDDQFVSAYARRHPDEDFAESFALYMQDPEETQSLLDQGPSGTVDKWDYLTQHFPDRLQQ